MRINLSLKYVVAITTMLAVVMGATFWFISKKHEQLVMAQIEMQAKGLFKQIVITRRWVADHGGVFVEKLPWVEPNPYLRNAAITDVRGKRYVKENPAMVTKQLSRYAEREKLYVFHITSLKLLNPENAPDEFETAALKDFETTRTNEASTVEKIGPSHYYRYIAPLYVEQPCLECHARQGYKVGDVRGAISVSIPMDYVLAMTAAEQKYMVAGVVIVGATLILTMFLMTRRIIIKPIRTMQTQMAEFSKVGSPSIPLIRTGDEIEDLSRSFNDMAKSINDYHLCLQEKIRAATSELTEKNEALARLYRSKSDFIAKISHELRTPLTSIKGAMDYLSVKLSMREADEDRDLLVFFEMIKKNADRLIRMVNSVLDYERIDLGMLEMRFEDVNLKELFQEVAAGFKPLAEEKKVAIRLKAMDVTAWVDEDRMKQVLTNLLSNALYFSPESSKVLISLECRDENVYAAVEDTGARIPRNEHALIFKQFYTKNVDGGTGLGLAICKGIVEAHGGEIGVEDSELGGNRFWFRMPKTRRGEPTDDKKAACHR